MARAVDKAHTLGIVHRDLKPANLFLTTKADGLPLVKILDFGIVKLVEEQTASTSPGQILGTPQYMSPEQASPNAPVTPATDRYALGLIAFRLLTGQNYYEGGVMSILGQLLHGRLQPPSERGSGFGAAFDAWFLKACHRDPEQRFASASEQMEALSAALGLTSAVIEPARRRTKLVSRAGVVIAALVVVGLAAASLAGVMLKWRPGASRSSVTAVGSSAARSPVPVPPTPAPPEAPVPDKNSVSGVAADRPAKPRAPRRRAPDVRAAAPPGAGAEKPEQADPYADQK